MASTLVLIMWVLYVMSVASWMAVLAFVLLSLSRMVILFCLLVGCFGLGVWTQFGLTNEIWLGRVVLDRIGNNAA